MKRAFPLVVVSLLALCSVTYGQETAMTLAKTLEQQVLSSAGLRLTVHSANVGNVGIMCDVAHRRVRLDAGSTTLLSDGKTIWNINTSTHRTTIDNVSPQSAFRDPTSILKFSTAYLPQLGLHTGSTYELRLTPKMSLLEYFKQTGIASLSLRLRKTGTGLSILGAKAIGPDGRPLNYNVAVSLLRSVDTSQFIFHPTSKMKVVDLRD